MSAIDDTLPQKIDNSPLLYTKDASEKLAEQLNDAGITMGSLINELRNNVWGQFPGMDDYGIWLIQTPSKTSLKQDQFMLTEKQSTGVPQWITVIASSPPPGAAPWCWTADGTPVEYAITNNPNVQPPSSGFLDAFRAVLARHGITFIGVGYDISKLVTIDGMVYLRTVLNAEEPRSWLIERDAPPTDSIGFWWMMAGSTMQNGQYNMNGVQCHCCHSSGGPTC